MKALKIPGTVALAVTLAGTLGCANRMNTDLKASLQNRARFDLECQELSLTPLQQANAVVISYGVTGCNHRAVYVLNGHVWVLNVLDQQVETKPENSAQAKE